MARNRSNRLVSSVKRARELRVLRDEVMSLKDSLLGATPRQPEAFEPRGGDGVMRSGLIGDDERHTGRCAHDRSRRRHAMPPRLTRCFMTPR